MVRVENSSAVIEKLWMLIRLMLKDNFNDIFITVPHQPHKPSGRYHHQLRVWSGKFGCMHDGHVDSGTASGTLLFETTLAEKLSDCECCFSAQLNNVGIGGSIRFNKETVNIPSEYLDSSGTPIVEKFDIITVTRR